MPNIYNYLNYREFLRDYYNEQKREKTGFSYQYFANKAGFKSKSFLKLVIDGKKNLTPRSLDKINRGMKLSPRSFSYLTDLVEFNQSNSVNVLNSFFEKLVGYNRRNSTKLIIKEQYDFYSKWYHSTIRELVTINNFDGDYERLGKMLRPAITTKQARQSVELLLKLGLIKRRAKGFDQLDNIISTGDEVKSLAVKNFHLQNFKLAAESIENCESEERDISSLVLGLSEDGFKSIKSEIQLFRKKLLDIANADKNLSTIYHVNFQIFPTSGKKSDRKQK